MHKKSSNPFLSVIIPAYNLEKVLKRCLDSVVIQSFSNIEIIIIDAGSTDNTWSIIQQYASIDNRIISIHLNNKTLPGAARNYGLDKAVGSYIHFCDGDDAVPQGAYDELFHLVANNNVDIVNGNYMRMYPSMDNRVYPFSNYKGKTGIEQCFEKSNTTIWNKFFLRSFLIKINIRFDEKLRYSEDLLFTWQAYKANPEAIFTSKNIYIYTDPIAHEDPASLMDSIRFANSRCIFDGMYVYRKIFCDGFTENQDLWKGMLFDNLYWHIEHSWRRIQDSEEKMKSYNEIKETLKLISLKNKSLDFFDTECTARFISIFNMDFTTFCSLDYYLFLIVDAIKGNQNGRAITYPHFINDTNQTTSIKQISANQIDDNLINQIEGHLENLFQYYTKNNISKNALVMQNYWNQISDIYNSYWVKITVPKIKDDALQMIKDTIAKLNTTTASCSVNNTFAYTKIKEIFGIDYASLQSLSYEQYMFISTLINKTNQNNIDFRQTFIDESYNGHTGMKDILKSIKGWGKYKIMRIKHSDEKD